MKYTAVIFSGPSLFLFIVSWTYMGTLLFSLATITDYGLWVAIFLSYIGLKALFKLYVEGTTTGTTIPTSNPFKWFVICEENDSYVIQTRYLLKGHTKTEIFPKFRNVDPGESEQYQKLPEVKRHRYNSYITTVEKHGETITFRDPFRSEGFARYPFDHVTVDVILRPDLRMKQKAVDTPFES